MVPRDRYKCLPIPVPVVTDERQSQRGDQALSLERGHIGQVEFARDIQNYCVDIFGIGKSTVSGWVMVIGEFRINVHFTS